MNIFEKMMNATEQIGRVAKNLEVGKGTNKYKAVSEADVLLAVKPIEYNLKIYSYPISRKVIESGTFTSIGFDGKDKNNWFLRIETVYRFVDIENPSDFLDITTYGDGFDTQDKAPGKAMTYSDKYALLKAYKIQTGEDPDQEASQEVYIKKAPVILPPPFAPGLLDKLEELNIDIEKVAIAYKCNVLYLTDDNLIEAIARQEAAMQKVALKKKAELLEKEQVNESII